MTQCDCDSCKVDRLIDFQPSGGGYMSVDRDQAIERHWETIKKLASTLTGLLAVREENRSKAEIAIDEAWARKQP